MTRAEAAFQSELDMLRKKTAWLVDLSRELSRAAAPADLLEALTPVATELGVDSASLFFVEPYEDVPQWGEIVADKSYTGAVKPLPLTRFNVPAYTQEQLLYANEKILYVDSLDSGAITDAERQVMELIGVAARASLVIRDDSGRSTASLTLNWAKPRTFTPEEQSLYETLHALVTPAVSNVRLRAAQEQIIQQRTNEMTLFRTLVNSARDPDRCPHD